MGIGSQRRLGASLAAFLTGAVFSAGGAWLAHDHGTPAVAAPRPPSDKAKPAFGLDDADILLYVEAVARIKEKAIRLRPDVTRAQIVERSLRAYLVQGDVCCDYLSPEEYRRFKQSLNDSYVGIGMEVTQDRNGRMLCMPRPESPAARAGIVRGSELESIDGVRVDGKSIFSVAAMARGKPGTEVRLVAVTPEGNKREFRIPREAVTLPSVSTRTVEGSPIIVLSHFTRGTKLALADALRHWPGRVPIIIDLRGNGGGDVHAAIDSAMLFLADGQRIVSVETRKGTKVYTSRASSVDRTLRVYVWQDQETASAAEVFIGALTDNGRAVSIGRATAGRATWEDIVELSDGSALVLAIGNLQTPNGTRYEGKGLQPTYVLRDAVDTSSYLLKIRETVPRDQS